MPQRQSHDLLGTLQSLLELSATDLGVAMSHAADVIAEALGADKVDAFLYDESRDSLVAVGTSSKPLSNLERKLGLDVLQLSNGGRTVDVYRTGRVFRTGNLFDDPEELRGIREGLKIQSQIGVPLEVGGTRRGMVMIASQQRDYFTDVDEAFACSVVRWIGSVAHRAELIRDIEQNAVEQGRRAAADEIITVLAHDLRNYLAPIVSRLYSLRHRLAAEERNADVTEVNALVGSVGRLSELVSDLLDAARIDRGLFELDLQPVDLTCLASEAAASFSTAAHELIVKSTTSVLVWADCARIRQCIDNVLANAIEHSPEGAPINVFVTEKEKDGGTWGQVEIIDEGPGIADDLLPRIFDRFISGHHAKTGLGLGLYLAKRIAVAHGGDIVAEQQAGHGARFVVSLRTYQENAPL